MTQRQLPARGSLQFRLSSATPGSALAVDVRLADFGGRWAAVVTRDARRETGIGATARDALSAALSPLGSRAAASLLADPTLFGVSRSLRQASAGR